MGQVLSLVAEVWGSFSLPYRAAILASFLLWAHGQRKRMPGLAVIALVNTIQILLRRAAGRRLQRYTVFQEILVKTLRESVDNLDCTIFTDLLKAPAKYLPHPYPRKTLTTSKFVAHWYGHDDPEAKIFYFIHGGGYLFGHSLGSIAFFTLLIKTFEAKGVKLAVFSLDYSLSPQAAFPTPLYEAVAGYEYLLKNLSINPNRIIVGGDSAGGALTLALCFQVRDSLPLPGGLALVSPWVDSRDCQRFTTHANKSFDIIGSAFLVKGIQSYLQNHEQNHFSSPILGNTQGLPPMFITLGGLEIFRDDILAFVEKVKTENGEDKVVVEEDPYMPHDYVILPDVWGKNAVIGAKKMADFMLATYQRNE